MKIERILVRGTNWIGDAVMTTPALQRLRASFPAAHISLLATPLTSGLFPGSPFIDEIIEYRRREEGVKAFFDAVKTVRSGRFDLALLFQNAFEAALIARLGGIRLRVGYAGQGRSLLLTHRLHRGPQHRHRHQINDYLDIVFEAERACSASTIFNPGSETPEASLTAGARDLKAAKDLLEKSGIIKDAGPLVALNTGATNSRAKCWPAENFAALADKLIEKFGARIVLIGGPGERRYAEQVEHSMQNKFVFNLAGKTSMSELIGLLEACDLLVSNDTGPAHIGAALGCPTLTIFGPTNEYETAPTGSRAEIMRAEGIECARCMHRDCPIDHRCMTRITPDELFLRAAGLLKGKPVNPE